MAWALHSNDIFVYSCKPNVETNIFEIKKLYNVGHSSHRSALRWVTMADNDTVLVTASMDWVKVWSVEERKWIKSIDVKNVVSILLQSKFNFK